jgi:hypothetical protein
VAIVDTYDEARNQKVMDDYQTSPGGAWSGWTSL